MVASCDTAHEQLSQTESKLQVEVTAHIPGRATASGHHGTNVMPPLHEPGNGSPLTVLCQFWEIFYMYLISHHVLYLLLRSLEEWPGWIHRFPEVSFLIAIFTFSAFYCSSSGIAFDKKTVYFYVLKHFNFFCTRLIPFFPPLGDFLSYKGPY